MALDWVPRMVLATVLLPWAAGCGPATVDAENGAEGDGSDDAETADDVGESSGGVDPTGVDSSGDDGETGDETGSIVEAWCLRGESLPAVDPEASVASVSDADGDGRDEVWTIRRLWDAVTETHSTRLAVFAQVDETLSPFAEQDVPGYALGLDDVDGDGVVDLLLESWDASERWWLAGMADGTVDPEPRALTLPAEGRSRFDANGDGRIDVIVNREDAAVVFVGDGTGSFSEAGAVAYDGYLGTVRMHDSGIPGEPVLVTEEQLIGFGSDVTQVHRLGVSGSGEVEVLASSEPLDVQVARVVDLDGDGLPEVLGHNVLANKGPVMLREQEPGAYGEQDFDESTFGVVVGALASDADLLSWGQDGGEAWLRQWEEGDWSAASPVPIDGPWSMHGDTWRLRREGEPDVFVRSAWDGDGNTFALWRVEPCD